MFQRVLSAASFCKTFVLILQFMMLMHGTMLGNVLAHLKYHEPMRSNNFAKGRSISVFPSKKITREIEHSFGGIYEDHYTVLT